VELDITCVAISIEPIYYILYKLTIDHITQPHHLAKKKGKLLTIALLFLPIPCNTTILNVPQKIIQKNAFPFADRGCTPEYGRKPFYRFA
jgi:hypothetical protein